MQEWDEVRRYKGESGDPACPAMEKRTSTRHLGAIVRGMSHFTSIWPAWCFLSMQRGLQWMRLMQSQMSPCTVEMRAATPYKKRTY